VWVLVSLEFFQKRETVCECKTDYVLKFGYVEQVICNEPGMSEWRKHLRVQKNVLAASRLLISLRKQHPDWCRTKIRKEAQAAYFILYNHDKSLIETILPKAQTPAHYQKNWAKEDLRLYTAINELPEANNLSISEIGRRVNDHSYIRTSIRMLPKTYDLLESLGVLKDPDSN